jgi:hypothetical protein
MSNNINDKTNISSSTLHEDSSRSPDEVGKQGGLADSQKILANHSNASQEQL